MRRHSAVKKQTAMRRHSAMLALAIVPALLLTGCATASAADTSVPSDVASDAPAESGADHSDASHGAPTSEDSPSDASSSKDAPSEAAQMICSADIQDSVAAALGLDAAPVPEDSFANAIYTCSYPISDGALVLSVMEMADNAAAQAHAAELKNTFDSAEDIVGLANLGLPAYETPDGVVMFVKDNMMLQVDARNMPVSDGQGDTFRTDIAYRLATNVLACWKAHHEQPSD